MSKPRQQLATLVKARRLELGMNRQEHLAEAAGIGTRTVGSLERGEYVGATTLLKIDAALGWEPGSSEGILEGRRPTRRGQGREATLDQQPEDELLQLMRLRKQQLSPERYQEWLDKVRVIADLVASSDEPGTGGKGAAANG